MLYGQQIRSEGRAPTTRYLVAVAASLLLLACLYLVLFRAQFGAPFRQDWMREGLYFQEQLAKTTERPKLVVLGGSATLMGLSCELLSEDLGVPVHNLGLNAGIDRRDVMIRAQRVLRPGDGVVLHLETPYWTSKDSFDDWNLGRAMHWNHKLYEELDLVDRVRFLRGVPPSRIVAGLLTKANGERLEERFPERVFRPGDLPLGTVRLAVDHCEIVEDWRETTKTNVSRFGDMIRIGQEPKDTLIRPELEPLYGLDTDLDRLHPWLEFIRWCRDNNIFVYVVSHPLREGGGLDRWIQSEEGIAWVEMRDRAITEAGGLVLESPADANFPHEAFWDTQYHLSHHHRIAHTKRIANRLAEVELPKRDPSFPDELVSWQNDVLNEMPLCYRFKDGFYDVELAPESDRGAYLQTWCWCKGSGVLELANVGRETRRLVFQAIANGRAPGTLGIETNTTDGLWSREYIIPEDEKIPIIAPVILAPGARQTIRFRFVPSSEIPPSGEGRTLAFRVSNFDWETPLNSVVFDYEGFHPPESDGLFEWRWCGANGGIVMSRILSPDSSDTSALPPMTELRMKLTADVFSPMGGRLIMEPEGDAIAIDLEPTTWTAVEVPLLRLSPEKNSCRVQFQFVGDLQRVPGDDRDLGFRIQNVEVTPTSEP